MVNTLCVCRLRKKGKAGAGNQKTWLLPPHSFSGGQLKNHRRRSQVIFLF